MKVTVLVALAVAWVLVTAGRTESADSCSAGAAQGFIAIRSDPAFLVGTIPSHFTGQPRFFTRRFNCRGGSAQVRRVDLGRYDVRFPGLVPRVAIATAISDEGVTSSALPLLNGIVRVSLRGPLGGSDVASRRDIPFSLVIY